MEQIIWFYYKYISLLVVFLDITYGACNLPASWQNKSWYLYRGPDETATRSAAKRLMNCTVTEVYGLKVDTLSVVQDKWECFLTEGDIVALKGNKIGDFIGTDMYIYAAFKVNDSFAWPLLYPLTKADQDAYDEHVVRIQTTTTPTMNQIATLSEPPKGVWYFMFQTGLSPMPNKYLEIKTTESPTTTTTTTTTSTTAASTLPPVVRTYTTLSSCLIVAVVCTCFGICIIGLILVIIALKFRQGKQHLAAEHHPDPPNSRLYYYNYGKYNGTRNSQVIDNTYYVIDN